MYYIPAGIMAKSNPNWAMSSQLTTEQLTNLNWVTLFTRNLIPVSLGNIIGGTIFAAGAYWFVYVRNNPDRIIPDKTEDE